MGKRDTEITEVNQNMPRYLLVGGTVGAAIGVLAAYLWMQRESKGQSTQFNLGDGVKIGSLVVALLRNIANL